MPNDGISSAEQALAGIYLTHRPDLSEYQWESEHDRWAEFVVVLLAEGVGIDYPIARRVTRLLGEMDMLSPTTLARQKNGLMKEVLVRQGCRAALAKRAMSVLSAAAAGVEQRWGGHLQRLLRSHAHLMMLDVARTIGQRTLAPERLAKVCALWLQNVASMPILLPGDPHIQAFCQRHGISEEQLIAMADHAGLNLAVLDDILAMDHQAGAAEADGKNGAASSATNPEEGEPARPRGGRERRRNRARK